MEIRMKKYKVNVNGNVYEVSLELIDENDVKTAPAAPAAQPAVSAASGAGEQIKAPMPGNILAVNVSVGSQVKRGDVLMILEAMKMENEIMSPRDGKITAVNTSKGATVDSGAVLCVIE